MISLLEGVQGKFEIVHLKVIFPFPKEVTIVFGLEGDVMVAVPLTSDQSPVPITGIFPFNVPVVEH